MKVFITGGAGFIGSRLAVYLAGAGAEVAVFDNFLPQVHAGNPGARDRLLTAGVTVVEGDVRDAGALAESLMRSRAGLVYHLAAETGTGQSFDEPARYNAVNVMGTAHLVEAIRRQGQVRRVVLAGSRSVYGEGACVDANGRATAAVERRQQDLAAGDYAPKDHQGRSLRPVPTSARCPVAPASVYASTKLMQEYLLTQAFWGSAVEVAILRLQNVYGVGQSLNNPYTGVLSIFCRQIQEGRVLNIFEDGQIIRDFVEVGDVVRAFAQVGGADGVQGQIIDIGSGAASAILEVADALLGRFGAGPSRREITGAFRAGDIRHAVADTRAARSRLGWRPSTSLDAGLDALVDWSRTLA